MTAIGKLLASLLLTVSLGLMTWAVSTYVQRPAWFEPISEGSDATQASNSVTFAQLKAENEALNRSAAVASDTWGTNLKELEDREKFRSDRLKAYAERNRWARTGNPKDLVNGADPKSGVGFYAPTIDAVLKLYDLSLNAAGKPKGEPIRGSDDQPLPGVDQLADSVTGDAAAIQKATTDILVLRDEFDVTSVKVRDTQDELLRMNVIRDSIRSELFYLDRFKGNVTETGETVFRRQKQLLARLRSLAVYDP